MGFSKFKAIAITKFRQNKNHKKCWDFIKRNKKKLKYPLPFNL